MEYSFSGRNYIGQSGEDIFKEYIKSNPVVENCEDVTDLKPYQIIDIDFVVEYFYGEKETWEIKTDTYDSGNICFEIDIKDDRGSIGCFILSKADYWFYYLQKKNQEKR